MRRAPASCWKCRLLRTKETLFARRLQNQKTLRARTLSWHCNSQDSDVALCFAKLGGRASPADLSTAAASGDGRAVCPGTRGPSSTFTRILCDFGFCRGTALCGRRGQGFTDRLFDCVCGCAGHALCPGPKRSSFTRRFRELKFCRGVAPSNPKRLSFTN